MGRTGEVLELMHGARGRYRTVRGALRRWATGHDSIVRFWSDPPRVREETETLFPAPRLELYVRDCERWWMRTPELGTVSDESSVDGCDSAGVHEGLLWRSLLDPAAWIPAFDFHVDGEARLLGRRAFRVGAVARRRDFLVQFPLALQDAAGAEAYELLVDRERGSILRADALTGGAVLWSAEFEELSFDEVLPAERFILEPSPHEEPRAPRVR